MPTKSSRRTRNWRASPIPSRTTCVRRCGTWSGYVNILLEDAPTLSTQNRRYMTKISDSARQMGILIDNLLAFSGMGRAAPVAGVGGHQRAGRGSARGSSHRKPRGCTVEWARRPAAEGARRPEPVQAGVDESAGQRAEILAQTEKAVIAVRCKENADNYEFSVQTTERALTCSTSGSSLAFFSGCI